MKGLAEIEFIVSVFVFLTTISFVTFIIINNIPILHNAALTERLKSRSYQYSELLFFDEGSPKDWQSVPENASRLGLSTGRRYFIDKNKVDALSVICLDYQKVKEKLAIEQNDIIIDVSYLDNTPVTGSSSVICKPVFTTQLRPQFQTTRLGILTDGSVIKIKTIIIG